MERPVIAFAGGGIPEIVEHEVERLARPRSHRPGLRRGDRRGRATPPIGSPAMGARGRRFVVEHGRIEGMCDGYAAAYRAVAHRSPEERGADRAGVS